jgi:hypothetical protein
MMRLAGHQQRAITYMMGNNVIAETMFRHDPSIILYAPLRIAIYEDNVGRVHLSIDQPSTKFASFGDARISEVGHYWTPKSLNCCGSCRCRSRRSWSPTSTPQPFRACLSSDLHCL